METTLNEVQGLRRMESILRGRNQVLEMLAADAPLPEVLRALTAQAERALDGHHCCVLLLNRAEGTLHYGASPSLPAFFTDAVEGLRIGPNVGSCGAAAHAAKRVVVEDVQVHPNWEPYRELAARAGFRACWSEPIFSPGGDTLGTFSVYDGEPRGPSSFEIEFVLRTAQIAGIAIAHEEARQELATSEERFRQLAESIREVFWLTDWTTRKTLYVSPAYESIWGRSCQSLLDDSRSWSYDIHPGDRERVVKAFEHAGRGNFEIEYRILRDDGSIRWIYDRAFPIRDASGRVYRMAGLSEDVTERKQAEEALRRAHEALDASTQRKLRSLTADLLFAEERERRRLSVDLHDGLNQFLSLARMKIAGLRTSVSDDLAASLSQVEDLLDQANRSARSLTFQLSPPILYDLGFEPAVQWLVEDVQKSYGLTIELGESGGELPLDDRVKVLLFRAVRELLINVAKHAHADAASVHIRREDRFLRIAVHDNGVTFDPERRGTRGLGLGSIEERLSNLGGSMQIESSPGKGTTITLLAPLALEDE